MINLKKRICLVSLGPVMCKLRMSGPTLEKESFFFSQISEKCLYLELSFKKYISYTTFK